jgi:hypothetical protein
VDLGPYLTSAAKPEPEVAPEEEAVAPRRRKERRERESQDPERFLRLLPRNAPAEVHHLGRYRLCCNEKGFHGNLILAAICSCLGLWFLLVGCGGMIMSWRAAGMQGGVASLLFGGGPLALFALVLAVPGAVGLVQTLRHGRRRLLVFDQGLVAVTGRLTFTTATVLRWEDIDAVFIKATKFVMVNRVIRQAESSHTVVDFQFRRASDGSCFGIKGQNAGFGDGVLRLLTAGSTETLSLLIHERLLSRLRADLQRRFRAGETLDFGTFRVNLKAIETDKGTLPLGKVASIYAANGKIKVRAHGRREFWMVVP